MFNTILTGSMTASAFLICLAAAAVLGILNALVFGWKTKHSAAFSVTVAVLPVIFSVVIMMVNGNIGTAVAVAGSFALVRFRSIPGTAREIGAIFSAMAMGLIIGMGYIGVAALFFAVIAILVLVLTVMHFGENKFEKMLKISVPENYDYNTIFDEVFAKYGVKAVIDSVKTDSMGSIFTVTYRVSLKDDAIPKALIDDLRTRNGNLSIMIGGVEQIRSL